MHFKKRTINLIAIIWAFQMILISLATVSPEIHAWVFHGGHRVYATYSKSPDEQNKNHDNHQPVQDEHFCPVSLFSIGVTGFSFVSETPLPVYHEIGAASLDVNDAFIFEFILKKGARAPPVY